MDVFNPEKNKDLERKTIKGKKKKKLYLAIPEIQKLNALTSEQLKSLNNDNVTSRINNYPNEFEKVRDYYVQAAMSGGARISDWGKYQLKED